MSIINTKTAETLESLLKTDPQLSTKEVVIDVEKYGKPASEESVAKTKAALEENGHEVTVVSNKAEAFELLKKLIPPNASVNNSHSTTLEEIGFVEYLKTSNTGWKNVHGEIYAETDLVKQAELKRTKGYTVDYFLSSAPAITEDGVIIGVDATGSRIGAWIVTSGKLIIVSGTNKIVKDVLAGKERVEKYAYELESARCRLVYKTLSSQITNYLVLKKGNPINPKRVHVIFIKEALGY
ncbi:prespore-specific protein [Glomus cerebriforme]|uniref:Prespore-specific protein n=1 Tax=Glomus cerebriforme TaxID=658196 RepID=A0A397T6Q2_9GLOM|nr:prespore-specific protein [Glomus cerebriforme]